jgi:pimeloyl-ACP methyl ester carboxylesterase
MVTVTPVIFNNRDGLKLFGILHLPAEEVRKEIGIILLSPGVKTRVAPHRLYKKMAEQFSNLGYLVLRFDFYGLGDAEGEIEEYYLADFYGTVGVGRYVKDSLGALDWIQERHGINKVVFAGLCGGALTGLLAGADDERVVGLIGLGTPVVLDSTDIDKSKYITQGQLNGLKAGYVQKLLNPKAWFRLFTLQSDFKVISKIVLQSLPKLKPRKTQASNNHSIKSANNLDLGNFNLLFPPAFFKMAKGPRKILLIFSGSDRLASEFEEKFVNSYGAQLSSCSENYVIQTIENANHILSDKKWVIEMLEYSKKWLQENYN